jgi:formylglycine-generating enzyme required for sulfatase activity
MNQCQRNDLQATFGSEITDKALGLQIFNISTKCVETWNGVEWIQQCDEVPPVTITHYDPACCGNTNCDALYGFAVTPLADIDLVFDQTTNSNGVLTAATGAAFRMKPVTGGVFYMGSQNSSSTQPNYDADATIYEASVHLVGLSSFYMSETAATQGLWTAVMGSHYDWNSYYNVGATHPCYNENWYACIAFCNKLSLLCGKTPVYSVDGVSDWGDALTYSSIPTTDNDDWNAVGCDWNADGFRLPTEAEWEYAARGGQKNEYTRTLGVSGTQSLYSGGSLTTPVNDVSQVAWYDGNNSPNGSKPVGTQAANELGLYDMSGNIWEQCWDLWSDTYQNCCDEVNPKGAGSGYYRVFRGGYWDNPTSYCRVSSRARDNPYGHHAHGFRVVCK